ncbi:MAG: response regulator [Pseudomonadales bacterium]
MSEKPLTAPLNITICDDSRMAQRQLARTMQHWNATIHFASDGREAIAAVKAGRAQLLFLDLNMPHMDGFEVLETILAQDLVTQAIVVSSDMQAHTQQRIKELGALGFIQKPTNSDTLLTKVRELVSQLEIEQSSEIIIDERDFDLTREEYFQETANIAMGQAGQRLSLLFDVPIQLSIPAVSMIATSELYMMLKGNSEDSFCSVISQGFVGGGVKGESIFIVDRASLPHIAKVLGQSEHLARDVERDILVDVSGLLSGSFLKSYFEQLGIDQINQGIPSFLGFKGQLEHLNCSNTQRQALAIEVSYTIPSEGIQCELLLVFTTDSLTSMHQRSELMQ